MWLCSVFIAGSAKKETVAPISLPSRKQPAM